MLSIFPVHIQERTVGQIIFDENPQRLEAVRLPGGFRLKIPTKVELQLEDNKHPQPMVSSLKATISTSGKEGQRVDLGIAKDDRLYMGAIPKNEVSGYFIWDGSFAELCAVEKLRDGGQPVLTLSLCGEVCFIFNQSRTPRRIRSAPESIGGKVSVSYRKETWVEMLRELKIAETVLIEIPLSQSPSAPWDQVWKALVEARTTFENGGSTGWNNCVTAIRKALEQWKKIEPEDHGPGWEKSAQKDLEARTKKQRLDNLRWHLLQCAHLGPHTPAEEWTRDDALLCLATFTALLSQRNP